MEGTKRNAMKKTLSFSHDGIPVPNENFFIVLQFNDTERRLYPAIVKRYCHFEDILENVVVFIGGEGRSCKAAGIELKNIAGWEKMFDKQIIYKIATEEI